ncbi:MAG: M48 family metallopeptidase [Verrucomicrobiae bacterium]|nr:M48 family metallopeptidase [Verrucomicrobiae bacterium]
MVAAGVVAARWAADAWLARLNRREVEAHAGAVPAAFQDSVDPATYRRSVDYTLARSRFGQWSDGWEVLVLLTLLFSGVLPASFGAVRDQFGVQSWSDAGWMFGIGMVLAVLGLPWEAWAQFRLEQQFGFNTTTPATWCLDRVKGFLLAAVLGYPLLWLVLRLVDWMGPWWWVWAWAAFLGFQVLLLVLAPVLILPLFNRLTPLEEGGLRTRLLDLGRRAGFTAHTILVMDGSRRSRHSNAFFTGFGRFRKIVLFDTLITQLTGEELEAVLAHEMGHSRLGHIPKRLAWSAFTLLAGFAAVGWLFGRPEFAGAFGFPADAGLAPTLMLFGLLSGPVTFWLSPVLNHWSRVHEFEADAFAARILGTPRPLMGALRKLSEKNLANLTPHRLYSAWHYSHPTLLEREAALADAGNPGSPVTAGAA